MQRVYSYNPRLPRACIGPILRPLDYYNIPLQTQFTVELPHWTLFNSNLNMQFMKIIPVKVPYLTHICPDLLSAHQYDQTRLAHISLRLTAIFPGKPGLAGFIAAKDDESGGDNRSYKTRKAPVKISPTANKRPTFYRLDALPVAPPTVSKHWREMVSHISYWNMVTIWGHDKMQSASSLQCRLPFNHVIDPHFVTFSSSLYTTIHNPNPKCTLITDLQIGRKNLKIKGLCERTE